MIPASFEYLRVDSLDEAVSALVEHGDEAKLLAGGHSLLPLMKLRLASPSVLLDVARVPGLSYVRDEGDHVAVGGLTRHHDLEVSELLAEQVPILRHAASQVGDPQVRHRGTIGGSVAHADPASDLPAVLLALRATVVVQGPNGQRTIPVDDLFTGFLETSLEPDEVLVEIRVPKVPGAGWSFQKLNRRAQDWAIVGVACVHQSGLRGPNGDDGRTGIGLVNMDTRPVRAAAAEAAMASGASAEDAAAVADEGTEPAADLNASVEFRRHLARVLTGRALAEAAG